MRFYITAAVVLAICAPALAQTPAETVTVIHAGTLLAEPGKAPLRNASVIISGRTITEVRDGFADVPGARVVDLRDSTVLPGLIDSHVHLRGLEDRLQARLQENALDYEDNAYIALFNARKTLLAGFTTVRDLGADPRQITSLRDAIMPGACRDRDPAAGQEFGQRRPRGSAQRAKSRRRLAVANPRNVCNGADDCRRAVR